MTEQWETIDVPRGNFISWGESPGQTITGRVLDFDLTGGTDMKGNVCPMIVLELTEPAYSMPKGLPRVEHKVGELVTLNCSQANLKKAARAAGPSQGDLVKVSFASTDRVQTPEGIGTVKIFDFKIARGAGSNRPRAASQPPSGGGWGAPASSAPPF